MNINNILIVSPKFDELKKFIEKEVPQKNIRYMPEEQMSEADLNWAEALVCFQLKSNIDYTQFKWVHSLGAGVDQFLFKKEWNERVLLTRTICSFGQRIAEYCLSYILKDLQFHDDFSESKREKNWQPITPKLLNEQKAMIFGTGEIGQITAGILSALGMEVCGVSLSGKGKDNFKEVIQVETHHSRLSEMDYVINTLPLTKETENLFNEQVFQHLSNAGFINVGRGGSVDELALLSALDQNNVRFAVLDVFTQEPLPEDHPFWNHPNVQITPHISAVTAPNEGAACFVETLKNIDENKSLLNLVDVKRGY